MIAPLALSLAAAPLAALPASSPEETDIVVLGRRLAALSVTIGRDARGRQSCDLSRSSGNRRLDDGLCRTAVRCARAGRTTADAMRTCVERRKPALLADLRQAMSRGGAAR